MQKTANKNTKKSLQVSIHGRRRKKHPKIFRKSFHHWNATLPNIWKMMKQDTRTTYRSWHAFTTIVLITACLSLCSVQMQLIYPVFSGWKSIGRKVKKGEKGIRIIAPVTIKVRQKSDEAKSGIPRRTGKTGSISLCLCF